MLILLALLLVQERPNVVLCMTDDQGWGDVSYNGLTAIRTENLDAMAAAGLRLNRFYAAAPVCSPTRASVLTGRHPNRMGTFLYGSPLRLQERTLAQALRELGYATGHFGKWHLNGVSGPGKPISADDPLHPGRFGFERWLSVSNFYDLDPVMARDGVAVPLKGDGSDLAAAEALGFMERAAAAKRPFLAVVWFGSPHVPHRALPADKEKAGGSDFHGELLGVDRAVGALRAGLRRLGVERDTLFWFCSDNGALPEGSTGGLRGRKGSVYEGGVRVPGLVEWPARVRPGSSSDVPCVTSDILPTLLDLLDAKEAKTIEPLDGISLRPLFEGKMSERGKPIGFWHFTKRDAELAADAGAAAWTGDRWKLVRPAPERFELYDLAADRAESKDVAAAEPAVVAALRKEFEAWQASVLRSWRGEDYR